MPYVKFTYCSAYYRADLWVTTDPGGTTGFTKVSQQYIYVGTKNGESIATLAKYTSVDPITAFFIDFEPGYQVPYYGYWNYRTMTIIDTVIFPYGEPNQSGVSACRLIDAICDTGDTTVLADGSLGWMAVA